MDLDEKDYRILSLLERNSDMRLSELGKRAGIFSASAVSRRIKRLKDIGVIKRYSVDLNRDELGLDFVTLTFVKAKYSQNYVERVAEKISAIKGVISVYFLLGDIDFVLLTASTGKEEYEGILNRLTEIVDIERTDSRTVLRTFRENDYSSVLELFSDKPEKKH